jgi:predicted PurR-regulated permease PerM
VLTPEVPMAGGLRPDPRAGLGSPVHTVRVLLVQANVWRVGLTLAVLVALLALLRFVLADGGSVLFTVVMAWFLSLAMEPAVRRLSTRMPRGAATALVMVAAGLLSLGFLVAFGSLAVEQAAALLRSLPSVIESVLGWVNRRLGTDYSSSDLLSSIRLTPEDAASYAQDVLGGLWTVLGSLATGVFGFFAIILLSFYLSADGPRLRAWLANLMPARPQRIFLSVWDLSMAKTAGYVSARVVLAVINGTTSALVFLLIGLPSWLALGLWTGVVAQFVPTIGTYISIVLPVLVGLASPEPWTGIAALAWGVLYQQVENVTFEPRISARAVNLHPAVAFGSVMLGSALFGVGGALLAIPVTAMLLAVVDAYVQRPHDTADLVAGELVTGRETAEESEELPGHPT